MDSEENQNLPEKNQNLPEKQKSQIQTGESSQSTQQITDNPPGDLLGQYCTGIIDGEFNGNYLVTVRVGGESGPVLKGWIFGVNHPVETNLQASEDVGKDHSVKTNVQASKDTGINHSIETNIQAFEDTRRTIISISAGIDVIDVPHDTHHDGTAEKTTTKMSKKIKYQTMAWTPIDLNMPPPDEPVELKDSSDITMGLKEQVENKNEDDVPAEHNDIEMLNPAAQEGI